MSPASLRGIVVGVLVLLGAALLHSVRAQSTRPSTTQNASTAEVGFVGLHGGAFDQIELAARKLEIPVAYFSDASIASRKADFSGLKVLYIQHTREEDREAYREVILKSKAANPSLVIIPVPPNSVQRFQPVVGNGVLAPDPDAIKYYDTSPENFRRLMIYTGAKYLGRKFTVEPPEELPTTGLFHPDHAELFADVKSFLDWKRTRIPGGKLPEGQPRVLITVHAAHLAFQQPKVIAALVRESEKQGALAVAILDLQAETYTGEAKAFKPDVVIHTCHSRDTVPFRLDLDVPHLHSVFFRKQSIEDFQSSNVGLSTSETAFHIIGQEMLGAIEPQAAAGTHGGGGNSDTFEPIPDRVEHLVGRALAHARLHQTPEPQKKVAIIYYDREAGKAELMRGSSTGMFLNAPRSLVVLLKQMKDKGYAVNPLPASDEQVIDWMMERGKVVGAWAPGELDRMVKNGSPALIPAAEYEKWFNEKVPEDRRKQVEEKWGKAPGAFMVWTNAKGEKFIVVPRIELGNVILLPQPLRGEVSGREKIEAQVHDKLSAPPHNYLATYFWLSESFKANALVHFGTHGSEFALPGKPTGLSGHDWPDIVMGAMPNFDPWIIENLGESAPVRRRAYGVLVTHLSPPIVTAGLSDDLATLHETIDKWETMEDSGLKERFVLEIGRLVKASKLDNDLKLVIPADNKMESEAITKVQDYLHKILEENTPVSLHILGEKPRQDLLPAYMVNVVRGPFLRALEALMKQSGKPGEHDIRPLAEKIMQQVLIAKVKPLDAVSLAVGKPLEKLPEDMERGFKVVEKLVEGFDHTGDEIGNLLHGLDGGFVPPGPGNNPIRNPNSVPTGKNMYLLNPDEVPMRPSWELGKKLADELIANHQKEHNAFPTKVAFDLRSSATFRDYGVMEGQILWLLGVEPVWDEKNLVTDVRLVPREKLGRPRVDVFIAAGGWYESNLPGRLNLWDKALRLVAKANESDNPLYTNTQQLKQILISKGVDAAKAEVLAPARIFGGSPAREYGSSNIAEFVERSGNWNSREEIAKRYLAAHKYVYTEGAWGEKADAAYEGAIQGAHTVVRSWSDYMTGPLSSRYTWLQGGSLSLAIEQMTGKRPDYVFSDVRDPDKAGMIKAEDALQRELRVRLLNRKWLEGMMKEGYAGADHMRFLVSNSFGWETMRPGSVGDANWQQIKEVLVDDKLQLGMKQWFEKNNPYAIQDATATMLEAVRKGYWKADSATVAQLSELYASNVAAHGLSGSLRSGGNDALDQLVRKELAGMKGPEAQKLTATYGAKIAEQQLPDLTAQAPAAPAIPAPAAPSLAPVVDVRTPAPAASNAPPAGAPAPSVGNPAQAAKASEAAAANSAQVSGFKAEAGSNSPSRAWLWTAAGGIGVAAFIAFGAMRRSGVPK